MSDSTFNKNFKREFESLQVLIDESTKKIVQTLKAAVTKPQRSAEFWDQVLASIDGEYNKMLRALRNWTRAEVPRQFQRELDAILKEVSKAEGIVFKAADVVKGLAGDRGVATLTSRLYADVVADFARAISGGRVIIDRITKMTKQRLIDEFVLDSALAKAYESGDIRNFAAILAADNPTFRSMYNTIIEQHLVEAGGRHFTPSYYTEMVSRVKFHEVQSNVTLATCDALGTDLVIVSSHNTTTPMCQEHEGKIYSVSGNHPDYPKLEERPPFHPNCLHTLHPYFESAIRAEKGQA